MSPVVERLCSNAAFSIERREQDLSFVIADASTKQLALIDDVMEDGWKQIVQTLRSHFDGLPLSMNRKYGQITTARFPRSILTTNLSKTEVRNLFHGEVDGRAADISLKRFQTWIEMYPTNCDVELSPEGVRSVLYHIFQALIAKVCGPEYCTQCTDAEKYVATLKAFAKLSEKEMYRFIFFTDCCEGNLARLPIKSDKAFKTYLHARTEKLCELSRRLELRAIQIPARLTRRILRSECGEYIKEAADYDRQAAAERWIAEAETDINAYTLDL